MKVPSNRMLKGLRELLAEPGCTVTLLESSLRGEPVSHNMPLNRELEVRGVYDNYVQFETNSLRNLSLSLGTASLWTYRRDTVNPDAIIATKQRPGGELRAVFRIENVQQLPDFDPSEEPDDKDRIDI